jgi:hypothetical protein
MKKHEYRCNRCLIIENKWISEGLKPLCSIACSKCGGLAIKLPVSDSIDNLFKERAGSAKKDRLLSENSALLDAATTRPTRRAGYETTQTQSCSNLQGQGGDSGLAGR